MELSKDERNLARSVALQERDLHVDRLARWHLIVNRLGPLSSDDSLDWVDLAWLRDEIGKAYPTDPKVVEEPLPGPGEEAAFVAKIRTIRAKLRIRLDELGHSNSYHDED